jgi:hypothetical protein
MDTTCSVDEFRMYYYKVIPCRKHYSHDWSDCPFAHAGEKAQRRCPRTHIYTGLSCPDMKKNGECPRGDKCHFSHNSFEYWLHPSRYRSQFCTFGRNCRRPVCFFAHTISELRMPSNPAGPGKAMMGAAMGGTIDGQDSGSSVEYLLSSGSSSPVDDLLMPNVPHAQLIPRNNLRANMPDPSSELLTSPDYGAPPPMLRYPYPIGNPEGPYGPGGHEWNLTTYHTAQAMDLSYEEALLTQQHIAAEKAGRQLAAANHAAQMEAGLQQHPRQQQQMVQQQHHAVPVSAPHLVMRRHGGGVQQPPAMMQRGVYCANDMMPGQQQQQQLLQPVQMQQQGGMNWPLQAAW